MISIVQTLQDRVRKHIEEAAFSNGHEVDRQTVLLLLEDALAAEIVCAWRSRRNHYAYMALATTVNAPSAAEGCLSHAAEEQLHADRLARRIVELGGNADVISGALGENGAQDDHDQGGAVDPIDMIHQDIATERLVIDSYAQILRYLGNSDPLTRHILEEIQASEQSHVEDLVSLLRSRGA